MKRLAPVILAVLLLSSVRSAHAEAVPSTREGCQHLFLKLSSRLIVNLALAVNSRNSLTEDEFGAIFFAREALLRGPSDERMNRCYRAFPGLRKRALDNLYRRERQRLQASKQRLEKTCGRRTTLLVFGRKRKIDAAIATNRLRTARSMAEDFAEELKFTDYVRHCDSARSEVTRLLNSYIPSVLARADLQVIGRDLVAVTQEIRPILDEVRRNFEAKAGAEPVPAPFTDPARRREFVATVGHCARRARAYRQLGGASDTLLGTGEPVQASELTELCLGLEAELPTFLARIDTRQDAYEAAVLAHWERIAIHGWDMEVEYRAHGRPLVESTTAGGAVRWILRTRAGCKQVFFSPRGKKRREAAVVCPAPPSADTTIASVAR